MTWVATAVIGSAVVNGFVGSKAAKKAAKAQQYAADSAAQVEYDKMQAGLDVSAPGREVGNYYLNWLASAGDRNWNGMDVPGVNGEDGYRLDRVNDFSLSPWQSHLLAQSNEAIQNQSGVQGSPVGGNALSAISKNTAAMTDAMQRDFAMQMAGFGPASNNLAGNAIMNNRAGDAIYAGGVGQANAALAQGQAWGNAINSVGNYFGMKSLMGGGGGGGVIGGGTTPGGGFGGPDAGFLYRGGNPGGIWGN